MKKGNSKFKVAWCVFVLLQLAYHTLLCSTEQSQLVLQRGWLAIDYRIRCNASKGRYKGNKKNLTDLRKERRSSARWRRNDEMASSLTPDLVSVNRCVFFLASVLMEDSREREGKACALSDGDGRRDPAPRFSSSLA